VNAHRRPGQFGGTAGDPTGAPRIAYPLDGAMRPSNIGAITFQWTRGDDANRLFRTDWKTGRTTSTSTFRAPWRPVST
jgi:hypothetical protein